MELKAYLAILWRRKWVIVVTTIVTVTVTGMGALLMPPTYTASTTLRVATAPGGGASYTDILYSNRIMTTYTRIATSDRVLNELAQRLGLDKPPKVGIEILGNTEFMRLTAEHPNPLVAQQAANTMAEILIDLNQELYVEAEKVAREVLAGRLAQAGRDLDEARAEYENTFAMFPNDEARLQTAAGELELKQQTYAALLEQYQDAQVREVLRADAVSVFEPADLPEAPAIPRELLFAALGLMVGLTAGVGLAFLFENLDTTLQTTEQIETVTQLPTLGKVPSAKKPQQIAFFNSLSPQGEALRRLRTNVFALDHGTPLQSLLVTSAEPQAGKSTIVAGLCYAIAQSGRRVVAVDCDMRRPTLHRIFDVTNKIGLSSILLQQATLERAVQLSQIPSVQVLTSGPIPTNPAELLGSSQMTALIHELTQHFDLVLYDTPALASVIDAAVLAPLVDGVLLVVCRAHERGETVRATCQQLANVNVRPAGVVVNKARQDGSYGYYTRYQQE
jgi:succinoglycan biosynthesis transport protein ExoP